MEQKVPPKERSLRKSVSFCLPKEAAPLADDDVKFKVPDRLLQHGHDKRPVTSYNTSRPQEQRAISSHSVLTPSPPSDNERTQVRQRPKKPLRRSVSVPAGLSLRNVLTRQQSATLSIREGAEGMVDVRAQRYSSSSTVKRNMIKSAENEFNKVAARVDEFCRRADDKKATLDPEQSEMMFDCLRDPWSLNDRLSMNHTTISHHGRRYRTSSNSNDEHVELVNNGLQINHDGLRRDVVSNGLEASNLKAGSMDIVCDCSDIIGSDLNERISKWLDDVSTSVTQIDLEKEDVATEITIIPL